MKKRLKYWIKMNKAYVIWVSILMGYTFLMLGIIIFIRATDEEGQSSFTSRVNQIQEETTEEFIEETDVTEEVADETETTEEITTISQ